jgi:hypothetical protein
MGLPSHTAKQKIMLSPPVNCNSAMEQHLTFAVATIVGIIIFCVCSGSSGYGGIVYLRVPHSTYNNSNSNNSNNNSSNQTPLLFANHKDAPTTAFLRTTLCGDKCKTHCKHYQTPLSTCFHGASLFPDDPSWNTSASIFDAPINATHFQRDFYEHGRSISHPCQGLPTDGFTLPYDICLGPFGVPRPWGTFHLSDLDTAVIANGNLKRNMKE